MSKVALAVCAGLMGMQGAVAAEEVDELSTVVVTATRDEKPADQQQRAVAVVTKKAIEARQPDSVVESLKYENNVEVGGGSRPGAQQPIVRGLSGNRVLQVIDGVRQNTNSGHRGTFFVDPELVEQVEVVKGPSSSLWGSGALGGVVATNTRNADDLLKPGQELGGYAKQGFHTADDKSLTSTALYGRTGEKGDWLLNGYYNDSNNIRLGNGQDLQHSAARQQGVMGKFGWEPDDAQRIQLSLRHSESNQNAPSNPSADVSSSVPLVDQQTRDFNSTLDYRLRPDNNPLLDTRVTAYVNQTQFDEYRIAKAQQDEVNYQTLGLNLNNRAELEWASVLAGADIYADKTDGQREGSNRPIPADGRARVWGTFVQADIPLARDWTLSPGVRYDQFHTEDKQQANSARTEDHISPSLGLSWVTTSWLTLGARYDEAFRAPTSEELFTSGTHFCMGPTICNTFEPNPDLKAETAKNKELSARFSFNDVLTQDRLGLTASWFDNDVDNYIEQQVVNDFAYMIFQTSYNNVSSAQLRGYELAADYSWQLLSLQLAYGQTRGLDKSQGDGLSGVPADKLVFGINQGLLAGDVDVGAKVSHYGSQSHVPQDNDVASYDGYTLVDLSMRWQPQSGTWQDWRVNLALDNLTDQYYLPAFNQLYSPGRNGKLSVAYQF